MRGVGETQLETDRRLIQQRIAHLALDLKRIESERVERRKRRKEAVKVALVGYTNAGKSTLLNRLTGSDGLVEDRLFATLDPLVRQGEGEWGRFIFIDTVGFIRKLPPQLVASFRSTLEEAREADILLHVVDLSHPGYEDQIKTTRRILEDLRLDENPVLTTLNKIDRMKDPRERSRAEAMLPDAHFISAVTGEGLEGAAQSPGGRGGRRDGSRERRAAARGGLRHRPDPLLGAGAGKPHGGQREAEIRYRARREDAGLLTKLILEAGGHPS